MATLTNTPSISSTYEEPVTKTTNIIVSDTTVQSIYIGNTEIVKVYIGSTLIYG